MKKLNVILGVLVLTAAATLVAPAPLVQTVQIVRQVEVHPAVKVFKLAGGTGVVAFRQVNGKLVSRFYRAQA